MGGHSRKLLKLGNSKKAHFLLGLFDEAPLRDYLHSSSLNNASSRFPSLNNSMYTFPLSPPHHHPLSLSHTCADLNPAAVQERRAADSLIRFKRRRNFVFHICYFLCKQFVFTPDFRIRRKLYSLRDLIICNEGVPITKISSIFRR